MNPVVHFEMPYADKKRMTDFYQKTFGWKMNMMGPEMGNYVVAQTGPCDADNMPERPGFINGGFYSVSDAPESKCPSVVIAVDDINASIQMIEKGGGKMLNTPTEIPGVGMYASFVDTEGNRASVLQPNM